MKRNAIHIAAVGRAGRALLPLVRRRARRYLATLNLQGCELSISLVSDARIRSLNRQWRRKDKATDVLSFPLQGMGTGTFGASPQVLGDIVISTDTAKRQAREYERTLDQEVERYLAHGLLHLLGYDHHSRADKKRMATAEAKLLGGAGMLG